MFYNGNDIDQSAYKNCLQGLELWVKQYSFITADEQDENDNGNKEDNDESEWDYEHSHDSGDKEDHVEQGSSKVKQVKQHDVKANWAFAKDLLTFWDDYLVYSDEDFAQYIYNFPSHIDKNKVWDLSRHDK